MRRLSLCTVFCTAIVPGIGVHSHYRREGDSDNENPYQKHVTGGPLWYIRVLLDV